MLPCKSAEMPTSCVARASASPEPCGQLPGFRSRLRYDSLTYPRSGFGIDEQGKLCLSMIGHIKLVQHRPCKGTPAPGRHFSPRWQAKVEETGRTVITVPP